MSNISASDVIFSEQANHNFSRILADLKRSNLSITNRLTSIQQDAAFVCRAAATFNRPLVANERCGSWYVEPSLKKASAYFKSTDGHTGQWKFSTRRLNLHLLPLIAGHDGCIIVDSTRRGKRMPDALSKTVPIWCCVLNRVLFPEDASIHDLYVPPHVVSESERSQMLARVTGFVESFSKLDLDLTSLRRQTKKPMRPLWVTPETPLIPVSEVFASFYPLICCTSSRRVTGTELSESGYIQGAADDTENWAQGLTPAVFWKNIDFLLSTPEPQLPDAIRGLVSAENAETCYTSVAPKQLADRVFVGNIGASLPQEESSNTCTIVLSPQVTKPETWVKSATRMEVGLGKHKAASRNLRHALPDICAFVSRYLGKQESSGSTRVLITCDKGKDLSVGVALALLCVFFDDQGQIRPLSEKAGGFTKDAIRLRLGKIMVIMPEANPNRATLQSVNSFLMDWRA